MPVVSKNNKTEIEKLYTILGRMLLTNSSESQKKQNATEFGEMLHRFKISNPLNFFREINIKGELTTVDDYPVIRIYIPKEFVPADYSGNKDQAFIDIMLSVEKGIK